jgi:2-succinyl-6-hydroxy-2,4-cyclohexadiene-1-carboxylate synthase
MVDYQRPVVCLAALLAVSCSVPPPAPAPRVEGTSRTGLHYVIEGSGPPVILVHAFQMDLREWDEIVPELTSSFRVVRYDVRGHGRSAGATQPTAAHDDLRDLLDELHIPKASLVGLSMGSGIVLDAALAYPDRVDRVVMVSPTISGVTSIIPNDWMTPIIAQVRAGAKDSAAALWWASGMMAGARKRGAAGEHYHQVVLDNARIWGENPANRLPLSPPAAQRLESLKAPLLVIVGERDAAAIRQLGEILTRRVPNAEGVVMDDAGHMISVEKPAELAEYIADFLSQQH